MKRIYTAILLVLILFLSCASLPRPVDDNSTTLLIPVHCIKDEPRDLNIYYIIYIQSLNTSDQQQIYRFKLQPRNNMFYYLIVNKLKPGSYKLSKAEIYTNYNDQNLGKQILNIPFRINPEELVLLGWVLQIRVSRSYYLLNRIILNRYDAAYKAALKKRIQNLDNLDSWHLSEITLSLLKQM